MKKIKQRRINRVQNSRDLHWDKPSSENSCLDTYWTFSWPWRWMWPLVENGRLFGNREKYMKISYKLMCLQMSLQIFFQLFFSSRSWMVTFFFFFLSNNIPLNSQPGGKLNTFDDALTSIFVLTPADKLQKSSWLL